MQPCNLAILRGPLRGHLRMTAVFVACLVLLIIVDPALAQSPFGVPRPQAAPPPAPEGLMGWVFAKQAEFYRSLSGLIRAMKTDGSAVWTLLAFSFLYGIFHAAGPGHGKAVISSYLLANEETWRRGIVLSFASALIQALVAIAIVSVAAGIIGVTAKTMNDSVRVIEIASYALIAAIGARLLWVKGRALLASLRVASPVLAAAGAPHGHDHSHAHHHHDADCETCNHGPDPTALAGPGGWQRGLSAIIAVGLRPCSGAIIVLVFALAQGLYWAGIASTLLMGLGTAITVAIIATLAVGAKSLAVRLAGSRPGFGAVALRGVEVVGAALVLAFGLLLLFGFMASERLM